MKGKSVVSVRIDSNWLNKLQALAEIDSSTLADEIREAVSKFIASRVEDKTEITEKIAESKRKRDIRIKKLFNA